MIFFATSLAVTVGCDSGDSPISEPEPEALRMVADIHLTSGQEVTSGLVNAHLADGYTFYEERRPLPWVHVVVEPIPSGRYTLQVGDCVNEGQAVTLHVAFYRHGVIVAEKTNTGIGTGYGPWAFVEYWAK